MPSTLAIFEDDSDLLKAYGELLDCSAFAHVRPRYFERVPSLNVLQELVPNLGSVVTDFHMPGSSGLDLARMLRRLQYAGSIYVLTNTMEASSFREAHGDLITAVYPKLPLKILTLYSDVLLGIFQGTCMNN